VAPALGLVAVELGALIRLAPPELGELVDLDRREGEPDLFGERVRSRWKP